MSFLYPFFLLGALGLAAPLWLHLRQQRRKNVQTFSALRFLDDQPSPREMPREIRNWPLFLFRLLALLLLVVAFAGPFWKSAVTVRQSETRIYVLDNTLSHRVNGAFENARDAIAKEIRRAGAETQIGVVEIAARCRVIVDLGMPPAEAASAVEALQPTHQRGNYLEGLRLAAALLERSLGEKRTLFIYGDRQENQWDENLNVPPFLRDVDVVLAEAPGPNDAGNLYVANTRVWRVPMREGSLVDLTLDLGSQAVNRYATIEVLSDDREVLRQDLELEGGDRGIHSQWKSEQTGWLKGRVEIAGRPDVLPWDNRSYFAVPPLEAGKIGLLARSPYLRAMFDPDVSRGFWQATVLGPDEIRREAAADKPAFDALIVDSDFLQSRESRDLVLKHLNNGRGILVFVSRMTPLVEGFLRSVGFKAGEERALEEPRQAFRYVALNHSILQPFGNPDFGDLLAVRVKKFVPLEAEKSVGLLFAGDGSPVLLEKRDTKGKLLVFGFGVDPEWTNWPLRSDFLPFIDLCLRYARAVPEQQISMEPGEVCFREIEDAANQAFILADSDGQEAARAVSDAHGRLRIVVPDEPGVYELRAAEGTRVEGLISVSASAKESQLVYLETRPPALDAWMLPPTPPATAEATTAKPRSLLDQRLGWILLLIAAAFLAGEMIWLARRKEVE